MLLLASAVTTSYVIRALRRWLMWVIVTKAVTYNIIFNEMSASVLQHGRELLKVTIQAKRLIHGPCPFSIQPHLRQKFFPPCNFFQYKNFWRWWFFYESKINEYGFFLKSFVLFIALQYENPYTLRWRFGYIKVFQTF